jgi:hypothetical protein
MCISVGFPSLFNSIFFSTLFQPPTKNPSLSDLVFTQNPSHHLHIPSLPSNAAQRGPQTARTTVAHDHADHPEQAVRQHRFAWLKVSYTLFNWLF